MPWPYTFPIVWETESTGRFPIVHVEVAFADGPVEHVHHWTDITEYLQSFTIERGRNHELESTEAGRATVVLDNQNRQFEPGGHPGALSAYLLPMRKLRIGITWDEVTYWRFTGFVEAWGPKYPNRYESTVTVEVTDGFKVLTGMELTADFDAENTGERIWRILTECRWPLADRNIATGDSTLVAASLSEANALQHIKDVVETEGGMFFISGDGKATFQNRQYRNLYGISALAVWGPRQVNQCYADVQVSYDDHHIYNDIAITPYGLTPEVAEDAPSQRGYFRRTMSRDILTDIPAEGLALAQFLLAKYKDPRLRCDAITIKPFEGGTDWTAMLVREIGDRISIEIIPVQVVSPFWTDVLLLQVHIEKIKDSYDAQKGIWETTWQLSPATTDTFWILQDAVYGILDSTTRLAY